MANTAIFTMQVVGTSKNIEELIRRMKQQSTDKTKNLYGFEEICEDLSKDRCPSYIEGTEIAIFHGQCRWSMMDSGIRPVHGFVEISKDLNMIIETYDEEVGAEYQAHTIVAFGEIVLDDCVEYGEYDVIDTIVSEKIEEEMGDKAYTPDFMDETLELQRCLYDEYGAMPNENLVAFYNEISGDNLVYNPDKMYWEDNRLIVGGYRYWTLMNNEEIKDICLRFEK